MSDHLWTFEYGDTLIHTINTRDADAVPATFTNVAVSGDPTVTVRRAGQTTPITAPGATIAIDVNGVTGQHDVTIDTSADTEYNPGSGYRQYVCYVLDGAVDGTTVNGEKLFTFALGQAPTLTEIGDQVADAVLDEDVTAHVTADSSGAAQQARYHATVQFVGGADPNEYRCIRWFKDDLPLDSGVTSPLMRVINADTGSDLIAEQSISEAGSSHMYYYDATGAELSVAGTSYAVRMRATIDGAVRVWEQPIVGV